MIAMVRAELIKLTRPRILIAATIATIAFAAASASGILLTASTDSDPSGRLPTINELSQAGGATAPFAIGASFAGLLVFLVFTANFANEHTRHTYRTLLLHQPRRHQVLAGKMIALLGFAAATIAIAEIATAGFALLIAPSQDIPTEQWFTTTAWADAAANYATAMFITTTWAMYGLFLATLVRSLPIAVGIGVAWTGPFEHLLGESWNPGLRWFPGLLLEAVATGGTNNVNFAPAILTSAIYAAIAAIAAMTLFQHRDIST